MNININTGELRLTVNDDPNRVIRFNPTDIGFVERFYGLMSDFEEQEQVYRKRNAELAENKEVDGYGIPKNTGEALKLLRDIGDHMKQQIDIVFGQGTSEAAFGSALTLNMFEQFFNGVAPFVRKAREGKLSKYTNEIKQNVMK